MDPIVIDTKKAPGQHKKNVDQAKQKRSSVKPDGVERNTHTQYDSEVAFANIRATANICRVKDDSPTSLGVVKGPILQGVPVTVPSNTAGATAHAMKKRCDHAPGKPDMVHFKKGHALLMEKVPQHDIVRVDEALVNKYLRTCSPTKAARLTEALNSPEWSYQGDTKHVFAKQEVLLKDHGAQPRVVYQGTDMYNLLTGCVVMELQRRMKMTLSHSNPFNTGNVVVFACGKSGEELGDIIHSAPGVMLESDFANNDGSQSMEFRRYEAMFYAKHGAPAWFVREFANNVSVRVWTRYGIEATVKGQRWSGETTTTTGNSYVGAVLLLAAALTANVKNSTHIHGGDDFLGIMPEAEVKEMEKAIQVVVPASGMEAKVLVPESRHHGTFYRKRYVSDKVRTRPVPQFGRVLAKINLRANRNTQVGDRDYMAGKYYSAAYEHRHVPGIRELLLETAQEMSAKPHFDVRLTKMNEMGGVENITKLVKETTAVDVDSFSDYLRDVYGIGYEDLVDAYGRVAAGAVGWLDQYTYVDKKGRQHSKHPPRAQMIGGEAIEALIRVDVG
jgi:hypothetical protein